MELSSWVEQHDGKKLYAVIGDPIAQSKSPVMHNAAFKHLGIDATYGAFQVKESELAAFVDQVRQHQIAGLNVTIPHKLHIIELLDEVDADAKALGAVNTIVNHNGKLIGYNTDGIGYVRSLKEEAIASLENKSIVVIGAGGASRGIIHALLKEKPASIVVCNRSLSNAEQLVQSLVHQGELKFAPLSDLQQHCASADVVINTTSVGMVPDVDEKPASGAWLKKGAVASDLIYNPLFTRFTEEAQEHGCIKHGGLGMFIYQGAYAFEYWTKQTAPTPIMREAVLNALQLK